MTGAESHRLREYLLSQLAETEEEQVELRLLGDPDFVEEYDIVVDEITDDYVAGKFAGSELEQVERNFFKAPERQNKLKFALALKARKSNLVAGKEGQRSYFMRYLAIAASVLLVAGGGFYVWHLWSYNAELNQGLAALQSAFHNERPLEARISRFDYAPYLTTRGPESGKIDQNELSRAELTLLNALKNNPTPAVHHGLGKVFLAKREYDQAIEQFDEALKDDPKNAQLYSDLGAAWLEKGKLDRNAATPGQDLADFARSLENLRQALALNPNLLEALFNRALLYQYLMLPRQAETDLRNYLQKDSNSKWAEEARQRLKLIENQQSKALVDENVPSALSRIGRYAE